MLPWPLLALLTAGCTNTYKMEQVPIAAASSRAGPAARILKVGDEIAVSLPADGQYGSTVYSGSGRMTQVAVVGALRTIGMDAFADEDGRSVGSRDQWRVRPAILEWEDRATEWSGLPDKIRIELRTLDPDGRTRDSTIVSGSSKWATFGGDHPQDMLTPALAPWTAKLLKEVGPEAPPTPTNAPR